MADVNYEVDYNDKRFDEVEADKNAAIKESDKMYDGMISQSDKFYQQQINASKDWAETQKKNQQAQTDFAIEQIEQQKDQAKSDYLKEQSGAYKDWQKQSNPYGVNTEAQAAQGMTNTGYSESSQVSMFNTYQNRVATARESYMRAVLNYDNAIKDARLQNNSALAQIAYEALQTQLELSLKGFQYKNELLTTKADKKTALENTYYGRYQDVIDQINKENSLKESVRQHNAEMALKNAQLAEEKRQYNESLALQREQFAWQKEQAAAKASSSGGSSGGSIKKSSSSSSKKGSSSKGSSSSTISKKYAKEEKRNQQDAAKKSSSSAVTVDMNSVLSLGYGPISASRLNELVSQGLVQEYRDGNKLKYRLTAKYLKQKSLIG